MKSENSHNEISQADIMSAFRQAVLNYGEDKMAARLDIRVSTLSNKLNPYRTGEDRRHFLNFWEADDILSITGDMTPLERLAERHGYYLAPKNITPEEACVLAEMVSDGHTSDDFHRTVEDFMKDKCSYLDLMAKRNRACIDILQTEEMALIEKKRMAQKENSNER